MTIKLASEWLKRRSLQNCVCMMPFHLTELQRGVMKLSNVPTNLQVADIMAKGPTRTSVRELRMMLLQEPNLETMLSEV